MRRCIKIGGRAGPWALACALALGLAACGGGGGTAADLPDAGASRGLSPATPAPGVYLDAGSPVDASYAAVVSHATTGALPRWTAWRQVAGDTHLYAGPLDVASAATATRYFSTSARLDGLADLRRSLGTQLNGLAMGGAAQLTLHTSALPATHLLALAELATVAWSGDWRHHGTGVARGRAIRFSPPQGGGVSFTAAQSILGCLVQADVQEQVSGAPGLFSLQLNLSDLDANTRCTHAGRFDGVLAAYRDAGGRAQLRLAATNAAQDLAIGFSTP